MLLPPHFRHHIEHYNGLELFCNCGFDMNLECLAYIRSWAVEWSLWEFSRYSYDFDAGWESCIEPTV